MHRCLVMIIHVLLSVDYRCQCFILFALKIVGILEVFIQFLEDLLVMARTSPGYEEN